MIVNPSDLDRRSLHELVAGLVCPRPIAWISSISADGIANLAPFSFFNVFAVHPHPIFGIGVGGPGPTEKHTLANARATGELTLNLVEASTVETANVCSADFGPEVDEAEVAQVEMVRSATVSPPRVACTPAAFECRVTQIIDLGLAVGASDALIIAEAISVFVRDDAISGLTPRADVLDLVGRLGGQAWTTTRDRFDLPRPRRSNPSNPDLPTVVTRQEAQRHPRSNHPIATYDAGGRASRRMERFK